MHRITQGNLPVWFRLALACVLKTTVIKHLLQLEKFKSLLLPPLCGPCLKTCSKASRRNSWR